MQFSQEGYKGKNVFFWVFFLGRGAGVSEDGRDEKKNGTDRKRENPNRLQVQR